MSEEREDLTLEEAFTSPEVEEDVEAQEPESQTAEPSDSEEPPSSDGGQPSEDFAAQAPALIEVAGRRFHPDDLVPYLEAADWARANPDQWARITSQIEGREPAAEEDDGEWVDPEIKALRQELAEVRSYVEDREVREGVQQFQQGVTAFRTAHPDLSDEDVARLQIELRDLEVLPNFVKRSNGNVVEGSRRALEMLYRDQNWGNVVQTSARQVVRDIKERKKASAVGSSQRTTPRLEPDMSTPEARDKALIESLAEAMGQEATS